MGTAQILSSGFFRKVVGTFGATRFTKTPGDRLGIVWGTVWDTARGAVCAAVWGTVWGIVWGIVWGTIWGMIGEPFSGNNDGIPMSTVPFFKPYRSRPVATPDSLPEPSKPSIFDFWIGPISTQNLPKIGRLNLVAPNPPTDQLLSHSHVDYSLGRPWVAAGARGHGPRAGFSKG